MNQRFLFALLVALLAGCGTMRPEIGPQNPRCNLDKFYIVDPFERYHVYFQNAEFGVSGMPSYRAADRTMNILQLSAGGEYGAYGAGFLVGWGERGDKGRPVARTQLTSSPG